jgi:hypothetical protein
MMIIIMHTNSDKNDNNRKKIAHCPTVMKMTKVMKITVMKMTKIRQMMPTA